jgi:hypothetical protein
MVKLRPVDAFGAQSATDLLVKGSQVDASQAGGRAATAREREVGVANTKAGMDRLMEIEGAVGCCLVDSNSGMVMAHEGGGSALNLEVAAAGNTEVVRAKRKTMKALDLKDTIEDILITLGRQYHLIRLLKQNEALFLYLVLDKSRANLAMARHVLAEAEKDIAV